MIGLPSLILMAIGLLYGGAIYQERKRAANAYADDDDTTGKDPWSRARIQVRPPLAASSTGQSALRPQLRKARAPS